MELLKAKEIALSLMQKHEIDTKGWTFQFDNAKKRFGCCNYTKKLISLSKPLTLINDEKNVTNTILHEIAHALTPGQKHNWKWKSVAISIGCNGDRCYTTFDVVQPEMKYIAECKKCGTVSTMMRAPKLRRSCKKCSGGRFNPEYEFKFKLNPKYK